VTFWFHVSELCPPRTFVWFSPRAWWYVELVAPTIVASDGCELFRRTVGVSIRSNVFCQTKFGSNRACATSIIVFVIDGS